MSIFKTKCVRVALLALVMFALCVAVSVVDVVDITEMLDDALAGQFGFQFDMAGFVNLLVLSWVVFLCVVKANADILASIGIDSRVRPFACAVPGSGKFTLVSVQKFNN
ncbi:MAG: hypothetical protein WCV63_09435 [Negativicutes bacterium]